MDEEKKVDVAEVLDDPIATKEANQGAQPADTPAAKEPAQPEPQKAEEPKPEPEKTVPYERFQEKNEEAKELRQQNLLLQQLVQNHLKPPAPAPEPEDEMIDPEIRKVRQENRELRGMIGQMADQQDLINARLSIKDYDKHADQVETIRQEFLRKGQYIPRTDIYTYLQGRQVLNRPAVVKQEVKPEPEPVKPKPIPTVRAAASNKPLVNKNPEPGTPEYTEAHKNDVL